MNYAQIPENLEKLNTPIIICDSKGLVIYKNTAAVRSVRLPRRNTSMLTHLGQTEQGELLRLSKRKKPSVLTVQTGDRNARALVMPYTREGKACSLWVFVSLLQTGSVSGMFAEADSALCAIGREICDYVKAVDEFALALPEEPTSAQIARLDKKLRKILDVLIEQRRGWLFEMHIALDILWKAIEQPLCELGYRLTIAEDSLQISQNGGKGSMLVLVELQSLATLYLHLMLFAYDSAATKQLEMAVRQIGEEYYMDIAFTQPYPPCYTDDEENADIFSDDLSALIALSPKNRFEIRLFEAYCASSEYALSYQITHEAENNVRLRLKLLTVQKLRLRSGAESNTEQLFVRHDLSLYFWHTVKERFRGRNE